MLFQLKSYLKFITKSKNQHGVHSPFVYNFITKCFYQSFQGDKFKVINSFLTDLLQNHNYIEVKDFGAGSKKLGNRIRKVSAIAKNASITKKRSQLLYKIIKHFNSTSILEIGTSLGLASASMGLANKKANVVTLEGCSETAKIAKDQFIKYDLTNINIEIGEFSETLPKVIKGRTFDLIFFDGNHQKEPTIYYFEKCLNHIHNDSIFIFDDIYWSKGMLGAWNHIKNHPKVTVSIDTYRWGIIFFRKEQPKQHFTIRV